MDEQLSFPDFLKNKIPTIFINDSKLNTEDLNYDDIKKNFKENFDTDQIIALYDEGIISSKRKQICFTNAGVYYLDRFSKDVQKIIFNEIGKVYKTQNESKIQLEIGDGLVEVDWGDNLHTGKLLSFFEHIRSFKKNELIDEYDTILSIQDLPQPERVAYIKIIVNMTFKDDQLIDSKELSEIQLLMAQNKIDSSHRRMIMEYINDPNQDFNELWETVSSRYSGESERILKLSLVKDMIRVDRITNDTKSYIYNNYITDFAKEYDISPEEKDLIQEAIREEIKLISGEIQEKEYISKMEAISKTADNIGFPMQAIWISGSVTGLSALGMLGIFITTGILGVAAYVGYKKLIQDNIGESAAKRDFLLRKILEMNQVALKNISEDIQEISTKLIELTDDVNLNKVRIKQIQKQFSLYINSMKDRTEGGQYA